MGQPMTTTRYGSNDGAAAFDTFVIASEPSGPHNKLTYALIGDGTAEYLWNTGLAGIPKGATVSNAVFSVFSAGDWFGSVQLSCTPCDSSWAGHTATWNNRPGIAGATAVVTHSPGAAGVEYAFDVTGPVQTWVANGGGNGFKVRRTDGGAAVRIWQRESSSASTPVLIVTWTAPGQKPADLSPNGVVGVNKPLLSGFPKGSLACRVQIDVSPTGFGSPDWSSGTLDLTAPGELDLSTTSYPGGPAGLDQWWRVSTQGAGGGWSDYSDPLVFNFTALPTLTITGPSALYPYVTDPSPTITWTFAAQTKFRLFVTVVGDGDKTVIYDTGKVAGDAGLAHAWTIPHKDDSGKAILRDRNQYRVWLQCYDSLDRVAVPGAQVYQQAAQVFQFTEIGGVAPFDYLTAVQVSGSPVVRLDFGSIGGPPDQITIWRDDQVLESGIDPADVDNPSTGAYTYLDWKVPPGTHRYYAERVVNGDSSVPGPAATVTVVVECHWLVDGANGWTVKLHNVGGLDGLTIQDQASLVRPLGSRKTVKRTTAQGYFEGPVWGWILDDDADDPNGRTADEYFLDLRRMANNPSSPVTLAYTNFAYPVLVGDSTPLPLTDTNGVDGTLKVQFNVLQQDDWTIFDTLPTTDQVLPAASYLYTYSGFATSHAFIVGEADITAITGTPTVRANDGTLHTNGEKYWNTGSITRAVIDGTTGGDDVYCRVPVKAGFSGGSLYKLKNPAGANPADVRLRSAGTIDIKNPDGVTTYTSALQWTQAQWLRGSVAWTWEPDSSLGASMGWLAITVALYFGRNIENTVADDTIYARYPSLEPVNETNDGPGIDFEVGRRWPYRFLAYPYGTPPAPGALVTGTSLEAGHSQQTTMELSGFTGLALITDNIGLNRSAVIGMTSVTSYTAAPHDATGHSRWSVTGLTANTTYYWQLTQNGTPVGPIIKTKTSVAVGTTTTLKLAVWGCKQNAPASTAVSDDIAAWSGYTRSYNLGDNGYPSDLGITPAEHGANFARQSTDPARMQLAALSEIGNTISDHDTNGAHGISNQPNYHDPTTAESILCWPLNNPVRMDDVRSPKRDRGVITYEGNFVIMQPDTRSWDKTDNRITAGIGPRDTGQTMLGAIQLARFLTAIDAAAAAHKFIVWLTDPAWNGLAQIDPDNGKIMLSNCDKWPAYAYERDLISDRAKTAFTAAGSTINMVIGHSDSHALQYDDGTHPWSDKNGIKVFCGGPFCQNYHALFGPDSPEDPPGSGLQPYRGYQEQFPADAGRDGRAATKMMYAQVTLDNSSAPTVAMTIAGRNCTPKDGTPSTVIGPYTTNYTL